MSEYIYNTAAKEATAFTKQRNAAFARSFRSTWKMPITAKWRWHGVAA